MSEGKEKTGQISELKTQLIDCQESLQDKMLTRQRLYSLIEYEEKESTYNSLG